VPDEVVLGVVVDRGVVVEDRVDGVPSVVEEFADLVPDVPPFDEAVAGSPVVRPPEREEVVDGETSSPVRPLRLDGTGVEESLSPERPFAVDWREGGVGVVDEVPDRPLPSVVDRLGVEDGEDGEDEEDVEPLPRDATVELDVVSLGGTGGEVVPDPRFAEEDPLRVGSAEDDPPRVDVSVAAESERMDDVMRGAVSESSPSKDLTLSVSLMPEEDPDRSDSFSLECPSPSPSPSRT
jgi:hypothetical protein